MASPVQRFRRALVLCAALAFVVVPAATASHLMGFGHENNAAGSQTSLTCVADFTCLIASNTNASDNARGLRGEHTASTGIGAGVHGETNSQSPDARGVVGVVAPTGAGGSSSGVRGINNGTSLFGIGVHGSQAGSGWGVFGETAAGGTGVFGHQHGTAFGYGVRGISDSTAAGAAGVLGEVGTNVAGQAGVYGRSSSSGAFGIGVRGEHFGAGNGVYGSVQSASVGAAGVLGQVLGAGGGGVGVHGHHSGGGYGVYGNAAGAGGVGVAGNQACPTCYAGYFSGRVTVTGTLTKGGGAFKIDHPLDPQNKYLQHSFVESPDMLNVYNGNVRTDARGFATVKLPRYFSALNRDFRYQLTSLSGLQHVAVAKKIANNRFTIQSEKPFAEVSWQVTGIRKDRWANANRIQVEQAKAAAERGKYVNPELYGKARAEGLVAPPQLSKVPAAPIARVGQGR